MAYSFKANLFIAASLFFDDLSPELKLSLLQQFQSMDTDGNGSISQTELLQTCREASDPLPKLASCLPQLFSVLDIDGNGVLDFDECKGLFFLLFSCTMCDYCGQLILDFGYTCADCWDLHEPSFDLCLNCYPAKVYTHRHRSFLPQKSIIKTTMEERIKQVQCVVCGDFHRKDIRGILIEAHMVTEAGSESGHYHVCEWCAAWSCSRCGKFFKDISKASPGSWLETQNYCPTCARAGDKTDSSPVIKVIKESNVVRNCSTCRIKANNGSLWAGHDSVKTSTVQISEYNESSSAIVPFVNTVRSAAGILSSVPHIVSAISACSIL